MNFNQVFTSAEQLDITENINLSYSQCFFNNDNESARPIVCVLCDRFIVSNTCDRLLPFEKLNLHQKLFYVDSHFNLSPELISCYQISFPTDIHIPDRIKNELQINKCLLSPRSSYIFCPNSISGFSICKTCYNDIEKGKRPKFCIANNFCFGTPPRCLLELTDVERAIITPIKTYGYCFCYSGGKKHKLMGSLAYYRVNTEMIVNSIETLADVEATIVIILHGDLTEKQYKIAKEKNVINIQKLSNAIYWLKQHNTEWIAMNWTDTKYRSFISSLRNPVLFEHNCNIVEDVEVILEKEQSLHVYFADGTITDKTGGQPTIEELQEIIREATLNNHSISLSLDILKESVRDFKDNNLINACLLQFPYGKGGMHEERYSAKNEFITYIDIKHYIQYLSMISQPHFHEGLFTLILYNMIMKQYMVRTGNWQVRNKLDAKMIANQLTMTDIEEGINATKIARGTLTTESFRGSQMLKAIDTVCNSCPHSNGAAANAKNCAQAIQYQFGCPSFFLTVTPDDDNNIAIQILSGELIDFDNHNASDLNDDYLITQSAKRTTLRLKFPGICALFFEMALQIIITDVLGWNREEKKQQFLGLFGKIDAFTCSIEEQGRSTLHAHFLIWISNLNNIRNSLHETFSFEEAAEYITKIMDKLSSTACYFNDIPNSDSNNNRHRKRFIHDCTTFRYGLPTFATEEQLKMLRQKDSEHNKFITCHNCQAQFSYAELEDMYLKSIINLPNFTSMDNENRVRRLKRMAIDFQKNTIDSEIQKYVIDLGYNIHHHTQSCFKIDKSNKKNVIHGTKNDCRYRIPQRKKNLTIIQNVTIEPLIWYDWNGEYDFRHIMEMCLKRKEYDAFQNVYCPAISYSKLTCNTNIAFIFPGPIGGYCFNYSLKKTQKEDTEPYQKVKNSIEKILSEIKHENNDNSEALRRILAASFKHQSDNSIRPSLAAYLTRNESRFIFSHEFNWCPLQDLKALLFDEEISVGVTFFNSQPCIKCHAMHYLCRPESLENLNPFDFYSQYKIVNATKKTIQQGGELLICTQYFKHPSYNSTTNACKQLAIKREIKTLVKFNQKLFIDSATFDCNILHDDIDNRPDIEQYSLYILLLFLPYRCQNDILIADSYNECLRNAYNNNALTQCHIQILRNIQDCKSNIFRFTIKNDDLDRATEPFHQPVNNIFDQDEQGDIIMTGPLPDEDDIENINLGELLLLTQTENSMQFDFETSDITTFNLDNICNRGIHNCGQTLLPSVLLPLTEHTLLNQQNNFIQLSTEEENTNNEYAENPTTINIRKQEIYLLITNDTNFNLNLKDIIGSDQEITVSIANGTASSIVNWANMCKLDEQQRRAFEIITGYYILSYINSIPNLYDNDLVTLQIIEEKNKLEILVGHSKIKNDQLICFLHGPGGSGKSTVISMLQCYSQHYHQLLGHEQYNRSIVLTAMTGVAATIIGGETAHSALCLFHKNISPDKIELWTNTKLLVIDEISFASNNTITLINKKLNELKTKTGIFGGIHIIFCGDLRQLLPVGEEALYKNYHFKPSLFKIHVNCYIELNGMHRFHEDPEWGKLLFRFREGKPLEEDINLINTRVQTTLSQQLPYDIKYATYQNRDRDSINLGIFQQKLTYSNTKCGHTNNFILIFCDNIIIKKEDGDLPLSQTKYFYENCGESDINVQRQGRIDPVLKLYIGCEVMLTENIKVQDGLANGTQATVKQIILNSNTQYFQVKLQNNIVLNAVYASQIHHILLQHKNLKFNNQTFQVSPKTIRFKASVPIPSKITTATTNKIKKSIVKMQAIQIPIISNNATTGHKLQGVGVKKLFVHDWEYTKNWPYVVLSRVTKLSGLFLRKPLKKGKKHYAVAKDFKDLITFFQQYTPDTIDYSTFISP